MSRMSRAGWFLAALSLVFAAGAQPKKVSEKDRKKAAALFDEGQRYYNANDYEAALKNYKDAYILSGEAALLYNMAQCYRLLGKKEDALKTYRTYLREVPESPVRGQVETIIKELEAPGTGVETPTVGGFRLSTPQDPAEVYVDGSLAGQSPLSLGTLSPGQHRLEVRKPGFKNHEELLSVEAGKVVELRVALEKEEPKIPLAACPSGQVRSPESQNQCCWPGQSFADNRCVGLPTACPPSLVPNGDSCVAVVTVERPSSTPASTPTAQPMSQPTPPAPVPAAPGFGKADAAGLIGVAGFGRFSPSVVDEFGVEIPGNSHIGGLASVLVRYRYAEVGLGLGGGVLLTPGPNGVPPFFAPSVRVSLGVNAYANPAPRSLLNLSAGAILDGGSGAGPGFYAAYTAMLNCQFSVRIEPQIFPIFFGGGGVSAGVSYNAYRESCPKSR